MSISSTLHSYQSVYMTHTLPLYVELVSSFCHLFNHMEVKWPQAGQAFVKSPGFYQDIGMLGWSSTTPPPLNRSGPENSCPGSALLKF